MRKKNVTHYFLRGIFRALTGVFDDFFVLDVLGCGDLNGSTVSKDSS